MKNCQSSLVMIHSNDSTIAPTAVEINSLGFTPSFRNLSISDAKTASGAAVESTQLALMEILTKPSSLVQRKGEENGMNDKTCTKPPTMKGQGVGIDSFFNTTICGSCVILKYRS